MRLAQHITGGMTVWRNWARNQSCSPAAVVRPSGEGELVAVVGDAVAAGRRVKAVGAGHSFTGTACTDGVMVDLRRHRRVLDHDTAAGRVTVEAGITLAALCLELDRLGLALPNMGDIGYQTIAGATATATHGTGAAFGNLSTQLLGLRLVTADGSVLDCSSARYADVFDAARVSVGALGIVSAVTLQCVPAFNVHAVEAPMPVDDVLSDFDAFMTSADHVEFYWVPGTRWALTKRNTRTAEPRRPRTRWRRLHDDYWASNLMFGLACRLGRRRPHAIPRLMKLVPSASRADYVDRSDRVFTSPRLVHFYEMEYAIPATDVPAALDRVRRLVAGLGVPISFPVEVRLVAADDIPLSTAFGRRTGYIAVHVYRGTHGYERYFRGVEEIMDDYGGRPHWGKLHYQSAGTLATRYPRWSDFALVRARLDPTGVFTNAYLDRVLGVQTSGHG